MRILHTADWHIGRGLAGFDLLDVQRHSFEALRRIAREQAVDCMIIAGDVYDRSLASEGVVNTVNGMLRTLNLDDKLPLMVISGNHDSPARLATGREWFAATKMHLNTQLAEAFTPVEMDDCQFFLLPYFEPREAQEYFADSELTNIGSATAAVVKRMVELFKPGMRHILIGHFFAAGSTHSGSETLVNVGGLDAVPTDVLAPFDYVALGHLHNRHALNAEKIQYAGSLLKYDVSEVDQQKGCYIIDTDTMERTFVAIPQQPDFVHVTASFADIIAGTVPGGIDSDNYVQFTLTDTEVIPDLMNRLRRVYPKCCGVDRQTQVQLDTPVHSFDKSLDPMSLLSQFYQDALGKEMAPAEQQWAQRTLNEAK
ncbi:exonuclease SbcCD subunit D [Lacticaseibacillus zhaodongensis]|uniref:exonuclease SbcCD subunit D n=1 Tax=Lacticaseibacillus zhaodongensis TaxID=2668065 RepID=UPI0012D2DEC5|nr:exonuclease SbcCD subunit D [Lacticaseibacillus zhaodongensis]